MQNNKGLKKKLTSLFPVNIMKFKLQDSYEHWEMLKQEVKEYESRELDIVEGDAKTSFAEDWRIRSYLLDKYPELESLMLSCVSEFCYYNSVEPLELFDSWFTIMNKGSRVQRHRHEGSVISGTLFLNMPEGSHGLAFSNPTIPYRMYEKINNRNDSYSYAHLEEVENYDLLLYPSWLEHFVPKITCDNRITISFNTDYPRYKKL